MTAAVAYLQAVKESQSHEFASVQIELPSDLAAIARSIGKDIKSEDLISLEYVPHITIKYGLHTNDPHPLLSVVKAENPIEVKFGRTEIISKDDTDVLVVKVFSPDLRRINARIKRMLPHTETYPKYRPHLTIGYLRAGRGNKYVDRADLEGRTHIFNEVCFRTRGGRKTIISLNSIKKAEYYPSSFMNPQSERWKTSVPLWLAAGGLGGAGLGRYVIAPLLARLLRLDPKKARRVFTLLGLGAGLVPGSILGGTRYKLKGNFFAPGGPPRNEDEYLRHLKYSLGLSRDMPDVTFYSPWGNFVRPGHNDEALVKEQGVNPAVYNNALWEPTFPVAQSLDDISRNPLIPPLQRAKMKMLVAESGRQQGVGMTGAASAGALMAALPNVVSRAVPTVGGAWAAAQLLGAPRRLKQTAIGGALIYSALKGFMEKGGADLPAGYKLRTSSTKNLHNYYVDTDTGKWAGTARVQKDDNGKLTVGSLRVCKPDRGKGLANYLLAIIDKDYKGKPLHITAKKFGDGDMNDMQLNEFYKRRGYTPTGTGDELKKVASIQKSPALTYIERIYNPADVTPAGDLVERATRAIWNGMYDTAISVPLRKAGWTSKWRHWLNKCESNMRESS